MNKILVEVSVGELLDKISILEIKKEKISNKESLNFIEKEYLILKEQLNKSVHLELWVKVKVNWADSEKDLQSLGYDL